MLRLTRIAHHVCPDGIPTEGDDAGKCAQLKARQVAASPPGPPIEYRAIRISDDRVRQEFRANIKYAGAGGWGFTGDVSWPEAWTLGAFSGERLVAGHNYYPRTMQANGRAVKMAAVTAVNTIPEFRRRGIVRQLVERAFVEYRARGFFVACLWPTQSAIYQRYGYSFAGVNRKYRVDTVDIRFADGNTGSQAVERASSISGALAELKEVYAQFIANRIGYCHRQNGTWKYGHLKSTEQLPAYVAFSRDAQGKAQGYVIYTMEANKVEHASRSQLITIRDLAWLDINAYRSLWSFIGAHDLAGEVRWDRAPRDDPAMEIWLEPRQLHQVDAEGSMLRIVDLAPALEQRGYSGAAGTLMLLVQEDSIAPWNKGCWRLEVDSHSGSGRVSLVPAASTPEDALRVSMKALGSLYSGYRSARQLAAWGLLSGPADTIALADAVFATKHAPHSPDVY